METRRRWTVAAATLLTLAGLAMPAPAAAHCDSMDGPVVKAAERALARGEVAHALAWVRPQDEAEIQEAFARTLEVRRNGGEARKLADLWFFETLVRVHRQGEGEPYTGLKPAGHEPEAGIAAADHALEEGSVDPLASSLAEHATAALREKFGRVVALRDHDPRDVETARRYVQAYVDYIHFMEKLHGVIHGSADGHATPEGAGRPHP